MEWWVIESKGCPPLFFELREAERGHHNRPNANRIARELLQRQNPKLVTIPNGTSIYRIGDEQVPPADNRLYSGLEIDGVRVYIRKRL